MVAAARSLALWTPSTPARTGRQLPPQFMSLPALVGKDNPGRQEGCIIHPIYTPLLYPTIKKVKKNIHLRSLQG
jgi:hypothetical protein